LEEANEKAMGVALAAIKKISTELEIKDKQRETKLNNFIANSKAKEVKLTANLNSQFKVEQNWRQKKFNNLTAELFQKQDKMQKEILDDLDRQFKRMQNNLTAESGKKQVNDHELRFNAM